MIINAKKKAKKQGHKLIEAAPIVNKLASSIESDHKVPCSVCGKSRMGLERCICSNCSICKSKEESICHCYFCGIPSCQNAPCIFFNYRVMFDPIRTCAKCLFPTRFNPNLPLSPDLLKELLLSDFYTNNMFHYLTRKGHYHQQKFVSSCIERGSYNLWRIYNSHLHGDVPFTPNLSCIVEIIWYILSLAYLKQPFLRGSLQIEDPGYHLYNFLLSHSKTYSRRWRSGKGGFGSSHLVDYIDYYSQVNHGGCDLPEFDQFGIDFKVFYFI
jgi:hypothetical protein